MKDAIKIAIVVAALIYGRSVGLRFARLVFPAPAPAPQTSA